MPSQDEIEKERRKALASRASKRPKLEEHGGTVESWARFLAEHSKIGMGGPCAAAAFEFIEVQNAAKPTWLSLAAWQEDWVVAPGTCIFTSEQMRSQAATLVAAGLRNTKGNILACDFSYKVTVAGHSCPNKLVRFNKFRFPMPHSFFTVTHHVQTVEIGLVMLPARMGIGLVSSTEQEAF